MPLYMDIHIIPDITVDKLKRAHIADPDLQDRYNVKYHHFWLNEEAGTVFLLIEGPDKESCARVHREVQGNVACQIVEMENDFYSLVMDDSFQSDHGLERHYTGKIDTSYRFVVAVDIAGHVRAESPADFQKLLFSEQARKRVRRIITTFKGREIQRLKDDSIITVFTKVTDAVAYAVEIQSELLKRSGSSEDLNRDINFRIGISGKQLVSGDDDSFEQVIRLARRLSLVAENKMIVASSLVRKLSESNDVSLNHSPIKGIRVADEEFLEKLFDLTEKNISDNSFGLKQVCRELGISRPQLYRKIIAIAGRSPNHFIRNIKMNRALSLIRKEELNVSEIAMEVGYNNPSYFSKCFRDAYGVTPSRVNTC